MKPRVDSSGHRRSEHNKRRRVLSCESSPFFSCTREATFQSIGARTVRASLSEALNTYLTVCSQMVPKRDLKKTQPILCRHCFGGKAATDAQNHFCHTHGKTAVKKIQAVGQTYEGNRLRMRGGIPCPRSVMQGFSLPIRSATCAVRTFRTTSNT